MKLAILSPHQKAYSETFIQCHRDLFANYKFYHGGFLPNLIENPDEYRLINVIKVFSNYLNIKYWHSGFTIQEKKLLNSLQLNNINVVLAEYGPTAASVLRICKYLKTPLVVHFHGFDMSDIEILKIYNQEYKNIFKHAHACIVVSKRMVKDALSLGCPSEKLKLCTYGPSNLYLENTPTYEKQEFVAVGRFVEKKAPHLTLLSFKEILNSYPHAVLHMCGDGEFLPVCKSLAKVWNIESNVVFHGVADQDKIKQLFSNALAFVQHSVTAENGDSEGTPVAVLEAMAAGLPVIATRHAGIPDVVVENETGILVDEYNVSAMTNAMKFILDNPKIAAIYGNNSRKRVVEHFNLDSYLEKLRKIIIDSYNQ
jgi:colanic acid/amylovoran biosynthesis glycosyltransferase